MWGRGVLLTRVAGIEIRLHVTWFLIAVLLTWSLAVGYLPVAVPGADTPARMVAAILAMLGLFGSLALHELAHAVVARRLGLQVRAITLFLLGGVAELRAEPSAPGIEARVAVAGPLASLSLAVLALAAQRGAGALFAPDLAVAVLSYLALANLVIAAFNMLPAFPLDGGRVLRAELWRRSGDLTAATRSADRVSGVFAWGFILLGALQVVSGAGAVGVWPILLGLFVLSSSHAARARVEIREALTGVTVAQVMRGDPVSVAPTATLEALADGKMLRHGLSYVPVVEDGVLLGGIDLRALREIDRDLWPTTRVEDVFAPLGAAEAVGPESRASDLLDRMARDGWRKAPVVANGRLVGIVTLADLMTRARLNAELASD